MLIMLFSNFSNPPFFKSRRSAELQSAGLQISTGKDDAHGKGKK